MIKIVDQNHLCVVNYVVSTEAEIANLPKDGLYDETIFMPFNEENVTVLDVDSNFTINSKAEPHGECIFVYNNVLYIHICSTSITTGKGMTYAKSLKQYLTDNPITLKIKKY